VANQLGAEHPELNAPSRSAIWRVLMRDAPTSLAVSFVDLAT
jgi:hypothetical protein